MCLKHWCVHGCMSIWCDWCACVFGVWMYGCVISVWCVCVCVTVGQSMWCTCGCASSSCICEICSKIGIQPVMHYYVIVAFFHINICWDDVWHVAHTTALRRWVSAATYHGVYMSYWEEKVEQCNTCVCMCVCANGVLCVCVCIAVNASLYIRSYSSIN